MADINSNGNGANYTDVLEVQVSDQQFRKGLDSLYTAYKQFLDRLKADGANPSEVFGVGSSASISKSLQDFVKTVQQIKKDVREVFNLGDSGDAVKKTFKDVGDEAETASKKVEELTEAEKRLANARITNKAVSEAGVISKAEDLGADTSRGIKASFDGRVREREKNVAELNSLNDQELKNFSKMISDELEIALEAENKRRVDAQKNAELSNQFGSADGRVQAKEKEVEEFKILDDAELKNFAKTVSDKLQIFLEAEDKKRSEAAKTQELINQYGTGDGRVQAREVEVNEIQRLNDQELKDFANLISGKLELAIDSQNKRAADEKKASELAKQERREQLQRDQEAFDRKAELERRGAQATEAAHNTIRRELAKTARAQQEQIELLNKQGNGWRGFLNGITQNFARSVGQMVRFTLGFKVLFAIINQIGNVLQFVFVDSFKIGFDYLIKMQNRAADIRETLINTVKFSNDWATNVAKAGEAAAFVTEQIKQWSFKTALDPEKIEAGFKGLAQAGGLQAVNNDLKQAVELSAKLLSAYRGLGSSANNQRVFVQNINNLFSAQVTQGNQLLKVLHLSAEEWTKIRDNAVATGKSILFDPKIQQALRGTVERVKDLNDRWEDVVASLKSYSSELLGTFAAPLFKKFLETLDKIKEYYEDHREDILKIATLLGLTVEQLFESLVILGKVTDILPLAAKGFGLMAVSAATVADNLANAYRQLKQLVEAPPKNEDELAQREYEEEKYQKQFKKRTEERRKLMDSILNFSGKEGKKAPFGFDLSELNLNDPVIKKYSQIIENLVKVGDTGGKTESARKLLHDKLAAIKAEVAQFEADINEAGSSQRNAIQEQVDDHVLSVASGAQKIKNIYQSEFEAISEKIDETVKTLGKLGNDPAVKKAISDLETQRKKLQTRLEDQNHAETRKVQLERNQQDLADYKASLDVQLDQKKRAVAQEEILNQQGYKTNVELAQSRMDLAEQEYKNQRALITKQQEGVATDSAFYRDRQREKEALDRQWATNRLQLQQQVYEAEQELIQRNIDLRNTQIQQDLQEQQARFQQLSDLGTFRTVTEENQARIALAEREFSVAQQIASSIRQQYNNAVLLKKTKEEIADLDVRARAAELDAQNRGRALINERVRNSAVYQIFGGSSVTRDANGEVTGAKLSEAFKNTTNTVMSLGNAAKFASTNIQNIGSMISQGLQQGGILGAIGGGLQGVGSIASSLGGAAKGIGEIFGATAGKVAGALGPIGAVVGAVGSLIGPIAGLFTRAARRIGQEMADKINGTLEKYTQGQLSMFETIGELQRERNEAITRLSGKKGGQDQLKQILPGLDKQLAQLVKQQKDISERFEQNLLILRQNDDVSQKWLKDWIDINKTVKEYIDAVGQAAGAQNATDYLNLQLTAKRKELQDQLNDSEKEAIQDILNYNDLLKQQTELTKSRNKLEEDYKKTRFDILSGNSDERRASKAVEAGLALKQATQEYEDQKKALDDQQEALDYQIKAATDKVTLEKELFNLTNDTTELRQRAYELEKSSLDALRDKITAIKDLLAKTANLIATNGAIPGTSTLSAGVIPGYGSVSTTISIGSIQVYGADDPSKVVDKLEEEINKRYRYGYAL